MFSNRLKDLWFRAEEFDQSMNVRAYVKMRLFMHVSVWYTLEAFRDILLVVPISYFWRFPAGQ